ncbi:MULTISPECIES: MFS transporter [unclassified Caballeronia]|uniref:MFS transporter n=1 Tax=unclassified Caballeronia TaxID=2646786 RepID=UPI0021050E2A|nr:MULTISPECIES: MFS transporter [unclassified Caballeronia]MDR5773228.1 MFS transporter [Caballeronia sp. LZ002]MDR5800178.1 MFS transporter [Caballeronia sp. LZ001]MDR5848662.1 MFS transporter [Caballeronia sp. LZ003]
MTSSRRSLEDTRRRRQAMKDAALERAESSGSARWIRITLVIFLMYTISYFDRTNIGLALPLIRRDLGMDATHAGLVGGIFFWGYVITFLAGGWLVSRFGARKVVLVCLICWGAAAMATGLVRTMNELMAVRLVLGVAEGPVWASASSLTASWFTRRERGKAFGFWTVSSPLGALLAGPISGFLLAHHDWRAMMIIEGLPAWIWAVVWWSSIPKNITAAKWLTNEQKAGLSRVLADEQAEFVDVSSQSGIRRVLGLKATWFLGFGFAMINLVVYGFMLWLPSSIAAAAPNLGSVEVGLLSACPWAACIVGILVATRSSDARQERRLHAGVPIILASVLLLAAANVPATSLVLRMSLFTAMGFFLEMFLPLIFTYVTELLSAADAIVATAVIGAFGNLVGGFVGPTLVGMLAGKGSDFQYPFSVLACFGALGGVLILCARPHREVAAEVLATR